MIDDTCCHLLALLRKIKRHKDPFLVWTHHINWHKRRRQDPWEVSDPFFDQRRQTAVGRFPEGKWQKGVWKHKSYHTHRIMVSFKNRAAVITLQRYWIITWRTQTSYTTVQPMDLKGFLIQNFKHLLNVIKQLGPQKHSTEMSQIAWIYSFHFSPSMWMWAELCLSSNIIVFQRIGEDSPCRHNLENVGFKQNVERLCMESVTPDKSQQRPDWSSVIAMFSYSMRLQHPKSHLGVDYNGILVWRYCPSVPTEYNHMSGWTIDSRGNERCLSSCGYCAPDQDRGINTVWTNPRSHTN